MSVRSLWKKSLDKTVILRPKSRKRNKQVLTSSNQRVSGADPRVVDPSTGGSGYFIAGGIGNQLQISNGGATSTSTPQLLGDTSLDPTIQSSLDNQEQTSLDANAKTTKQPPNSAAVQLKKSEANNDFIFAPFAIIPGVLLVASKNPITVVFGGVLVFGGFVVVGMGIGKLIDANQETK